MADDSLINPPNNATVQATSSGCPATAFIKSNRDPAGVLVGTQTGQQWVLNLSVPTVGNTLGFWCVSTHIPVQLLYT